MFKNMLGVMGLLGAATAGELPAADKKHHAKKGADKKPRGGFKRVMREAKKLRERKKLRALKKFRRN